MRQVELSKIKTLIAFTFQIRKKEIVGWCAAIFGIVLLYTILFPSIKDMAQMEMETMPKELLELIGMGEFSNMGNYITYFGMIYGMILIAISVFSISFATRILAEEERDQTMEFLYATCISRSEIYIAKYVTALLSCLLVIFSAATAGICSGLFSNEATFVFADYIKIILISSMTPLLFLTLSFQIAAVSKRKGTVTIGIFIMMVSYVLGYLSKLLGTGGTWLSWFSPFTLFSYENAIKWTMTTRLWFSGFFICLIGLWCIGIMLYKQRDFQL